MSAARSSRGTVVVAGALAQRPLIAGHAWVFLNWLHGLRSIGYDTVFVDRLEPEMLDGHVEASRQWAWLREVMHGAQLDGQYALLVDGGRRCLGMGRDELDRRTDGAVALFNFMGYLDDRRILDAVHRRVFVDIDPGFGQLWRAQGLHDPFLGHDIVATVGLGADRPDSVVADTGLPTITTLPPVALDRWPATAAPRRGRARVTSIGTWRGPFGPIDHEGAMYGLRVHEFRRFADLPDRVPEGAFEFALDIDPCDGADADRLRAGGWRLADPQLVAGNIEHYRTYIADSVAEFTVAKGMYVRTRGGWFSDRSACYLASGRAVIAQDTGFSAHLPTGDGLLCFDDPDDAEAALRKVLADVEHHGRAARAIAESHFDARRVLPQLLQRVGVSQ